MNVEIEERIRQHEAYNNYYTLQSINKCIKITLVRRENTSFLVLRSRLIYEYYIEHSRFLEVFVETPLIFDITVKNLM